MTSGLGSWFRGRAERFLGNLHVPPAWTRRGEGTPPIPPPSRPFFISPPLGPPPLGIGAWHEPIEPRLRGLVADCLGVGPDELRADVSLLDDLAADSLDLLEVAIAAEDELGITISERTLAGVRTYGDLVAEVSRLQAGHRREEVSPVVRSRVFPAAAGGGSLERAGALTPYLAQTIAEDAMHAGPGTRVELTVPAHTGPAGLASVEARFAQLGAWGVDVRVRRQGGRAITGAAAPGSTTPTTASR